MSIVDIFSAINRICTMYTIYYVNLFCMAVAKGFANSAHLHSQPHVIEAAFRNILSVICIHDTINLNWVDNLTLLNYVGKWMQAHAHQKFSCDSNTRNAYFTHSTSFNFQTYSCRAVELIPISHRHLRYSFNFEYSTSADSSKKALQILY